MQHSIFWARLIGLYALIMSLWTFVNIKNLYSIMVNLTDNSSYTMILGMFALFLGLAIVVSHQVWRGWPILVTIVGYWITLKAIVLLFFPHWVQHIVAFWQNNNMMFAPVPALIVGVVLLYFGFFKSHCTK